MRGGILGPGARCPPDRLAWEPGRAELLGTYHPEHQGCLTHAHLGYEVAEGNAPPQ
ncbi:hypothetical protein GCM10010372_84430 [Streptomyces tauricus]|nr:hypothetical protein GCM10010372_84430 [Streptomyces tauricus]